MGVKNDNLLKQFSYNLNTEELSFINNSLVNNYQNVQQNYRLSSTPALRSSVRSLVVNYNAFQKVSRARFDENRANTTGTNFSFLSQKQAFLTDSKVPYLTLLKKNQDFFYNSPVYNPEVRFFFNDLETLNNLVNSSIYDFPFLLSQTSDVIRYS